MSKEWGRAALVLGIGGIMAWRAFTPEAKQRVGQFLDDLADAVVQARQRKQQQAQEELAASLDSSSDPRGSILLGGSLAPGEITDQHPPSACRWPTIGSICLGLMRLCGRSASARSYWRYMWPLPRVCSAPTFSRLRPVVLTQVTPLIWSLGSFSTCPTGRDLD